MSRILETGMLKQKNRGCRNRTMRYVITFLKEKHLPLVMALQAIIVKNLERPDLLQSFSPEFMKQHMGRRGVVLGVFVGNQLAAFRNLYYPHCRDKEWNLGLDLGLAREELTKVVNLQMVCVHPRFRGNSLALKMNRISLQLLREKGTHHHVCATVSPYNIWNIPILLQSGFCIAKLKSKYGGKKRYIVHQNLRRPFLFEDSSAVHVSLDDHDAQKQWLGSGFYGVALCRKKSVSREDPVNGFDLVFKSFCRQNTCTNDGAMSAWWTGPQGRPAPLSAGTQV